jgi:hypothetical protein
MTENLYTLITRRSHSGLMINSGNAYSDLLDIAADQLPAEYTREAWADRVRAFDACAEPGHYVTGVDYVIVCERAGVEARGVVAVPLDLIELMAAELEWHNEEMRHDSRELAVALRALCGRTRRGDEGPFGWRERLSSALCDWHRTDPVDAPEPTKSPAEVEELKRQWLADPCWDIEGTPGFEAHAAELIEWKLRDNIEDLEAEAASLRAQLAARRPRLFEFVNGSEIDVDRYIALDATACEHVATFQLHHSYHRVYFDSDEQRASELERMRAFRDGRVS